MVAALGCPIINLKKMKKEKEKEKENKERKKTQEG